MLDEVDERDSDEDIDIDDVADIEPNGNINILEPQLDYYAPDGTQWPTKPLRTSQTRSHNILRQRGGPVCKEIMTRIDAFNMGFFNVMKDIVGRHTNRKGQQLTQIWNEKNPNSPPWKKTDRVEMDAFYAIVLSCGLHKSNMEILDELWAPHSFPLYRAAMSRDRFKAILRTICFDDHATREARKSTDKAAAISEMWMLMNDNLRKQYRPHNNITIDELFSLRGRVSFRQYIPSKPAKYGIKIFWACDSKTNYPLNGIIYLGRQPGQKTGKNLGENIVMKLMEPYFS